MTINVTLKSRKGAMRALDKEMYAEIDRQIENEKKTLVTALKDATPVDTGKARDGWKSTEEGISNDVEYIDKLNGGSSRQAPEHFVERTLLAHKGIHPSGIIVRRK